MKRGFGTTASGAAIQLFARSDLETAARTKEIRLSVQMHDTKPCLSSWGVGGIAFLATFLVFLVQFRVGLNLADESFLWYGAQRTAAGAVPIRDFMSYDIGRYYWAAGFMSLVGDDGIVVLRISLAAFQAIGLFVALTLVRKAAPDSSWIVLIVCAVLLIIWMQPRHKLFDITASICVLAAVVWMLEKPVIRTYFFAGVIVGLCAVIGRNHGAYGLMCALAALTVVALQKRGPPWWKGMLAGGAGVLLGYSPVLILAFTQPGFGDAMLTDLSWLLERMRTPDGTNIALPIPWPWLVNFNSGDAGDIVSNLVVGLFFLALLVGPVAALLVLALRRVSVQRMPVLWGSAITALPYAHHAFSRADLGHLAQGIFPLLIGLLALPLANRANRIILPVGLLILSLPAAIRYQPGWEWVDAGRGVPLTAGGTQLLVAPHIAYEIESVRALKAKYVPPGGTVMAAPFLPGVYAVLHQVSPIWSIYATLPQSEKVQYQEIERLRADPPSLVLIQTNGVDGREELSFPRSHPLIYQYIATNYQQIDEADWPGMEVYVGPVESSIPER